MSEALPRAFFIDGDDHDAPDDAPLGVRIEAALGRIETEIARAQGCYLVVAYPLDEADHRRLKEAADRKGARFLVLTLAPPLEVALADRGARTLSREEKNRIVEMYDEGYHARPFSDLILDTSVSSLPGTIEAARAMILAINL
ncbi:shikimate kinase [Microvirga lotononidis]|uniref:shikimate kinase n=1 Tax=Microvirga lotononidis TaxID=864069 RepID=UPI001AEBE6A9|nr:shikimate kinase [Microvirga lotononidis]WQO28298.1 shikimate kinase [Microvirga lotononidis]